jgi:hypothetical protein
MEIHIVIQTTEPLAGTARAGDRTPRPFEGWLELLRELSSLINAEDAPAPGTGAAGGES